MKKQLEIKFRRNFSQHENDHTLVFFSEDMKVIYFKASGNIKVYDNRLTGKKLPNEVNSYERVEESYYITLS